MISHIKYKIYFLGIGGIGMSAIARYFNHIGLKVYGYDKTETDLTKKLQSEGIQIHYDDNYKQILKYNIDNTNCFVVLTPAIPKENMELAWFIKNNFEIFKRSEILGLLSKQQKSIAVAGTHGKTTTSTLIAHILKQSRLDCSAFLGGISTNYNTNLLLNERKSKDPLMVVEADEFDRSFLTLSPYLSIITSTDADHLDIYGKHKELKKSFLDFSNCLVSGGTLIVKKELDILKKLKVPYITYSINEKADVYAFNIIIKNGEYIFDLNYKNKIYKKMKLGMPGLHNVENAVAASAACLMLGVSITELRKSLKNFLGVKRRFEYIVKNKNQIFIDDYAHHPEELKAIISSVKNMYKGKKISIVFQPHLYSRTRDLAKGFAESLSLADEVFLLDIYPARELPIKGVTSKILYDKIKSKSKSLCSKEELLNRIKFNKPEIFLTLGAGDIDMLVDPLKKIFLANKSK